MSFIKTFFFRHVNFFAAGIFLIFAVIVQSCSTFNYKTYDEKANQNIDDPEPDYKLTLNNDFQDYTNFMFIGNRVENFGTYFNTFFNAKQNFNEAYDDYVTRTLANYGQSIDSVYITASLSQESIDKFNKAIEKASKVIQFHKSSAFMDQAVLMVGKCYYFLGDNIKAERKFSEFISKLSNSRYIDEAVLYYAKTQIRLNNVKDALDKIDGLTRDSKDGSIKAQAFQTIAEYYLSLKDYEGAIANFKKSIELSSDEEFKAQMQFLIASVVAQSDPKNAINEYNKVLTFSPKYDLAYLTRYNSLKYSILSGNYSSALSNVEKLQVNYKDAADYVSQLEYLKGKYYNQKNDYKNAIKVYDDIILTYPKTQSSSDASFDIAQYYEKEKKDYLNAYKYYRFSTEESSSGHNALAAASKMKTYKRYFELKSLITGVAINTDYDSTFIGKQNVPANQEGQPIKRGNDNGNGHDNGTGHDNGNGKPGGFSGVNFQSNFLRNFKEADSLQTDSTAIKEEAASKAKFELAELFYYELQRPDSCEFYLSSAYNQSGNYDFKSKILFAMADLYKSTGQPAKADEVLHKILKEYSLSPVVIDTRKLLNMSVIEDAGRDAADSIYLDAENKFIKSEYPSALDGFKDIISHYSASKYIDKSIYAAGWIYENVFFKPDSAFIYYSNIVKTYPNTEVSAMVSQKVDEYRNSLSLSKDSSSSIKDSSNSTDLNKTLIDSNSIVKDTSKNKQTGIDTTIVKKPEEKVGEKKENNPENPPKPDDNNIKKDDNINGEGTDNGNNEKKKGK